jgi:hypothetical protein
MDVPSGVWTAEEYDKLPPYDLETAYQPPSVFLCHQKDGRVCAGWAGCHDGTQLLSLRFAGLLDVLPREVAEQVIEYVSPVPLFPSGAAAAAHGMRDIDEPGPAAQALMADLVRKQTARRERGEQV